MYDDVTYVYDDVTYVYDDVTYAPDLTRKEQKLLSKISKYYHLPQWVSTGDYLKIARDLDMAQVSIFFFWKIFIDLKKI